MVEGVSTRLVARAPLRVRHVADEFHVRTDVRRQVDILWEAELQQRPKRIHDGKLFSFVRLERGIVWGWFVDYRYFLAQRAQPSLHPKLGVYPMGVSGLIRLVHSNRSRYVVARRASWVTEYPGHWELVPSGGVDRESVSACGDVDIEVHLLRELEEETPIRREQVESLSLIGLVYDDGDGVYDLCYEISARMSSARLESRFRAGGQYSDLRIMSRRQLASFVSANLQAVVPTSVAILKSRRLIAPSR